MGIMALYTSLYFLSTVGSGKKKEIVTAEVVASSSTEGVPSVESPDFEGWISAPGNLEKLFE
jgi:hypothetical protein